MRRREGRKDEGGEGGKEGRDEIEQHVVSEYFGDGSIMYFITLYYILFKHNNFLPYYVIHVNQIINRLLITQGVCTTSYDVFILFYNASFKQYESTVSYVGEDAGRLWGCHWDTCGRLFRRLPDSWQGS